MILERYRLAKQSPISKDVSHILLYQLNSPFQKVSHILPNYLQLSSVVQIQLNWKILI